MARFEITLTDSSMEAVTEADGYEQEGPMTTFFRSSNHSQILDSWATRLVSIRSTEILMVRRCESPSTIELGNVPVLVAS